MLINSISIFFETLIFEFGFDQGNEVRELAGSLGIFRGQEIVKDYNGKNRIFIGQKRKS